MDKSLADQLRDIADDLDDAEGVVRTAASPRRFRLCITSRTPIGHHVAEYRFTEGDTLEFPLPMAVEGLHLWVEAWD
jgi:hypothetical protein